MNLKIIAFSFIRISLDWVIGSGWSWTCLKEQNLPNLYIKFERAQSCRCYDIHVQTSSRQIIFLFFLPTLKAISFFNILIYCFLLPLGSQMVKLVFGIITFRTVPFASVLIFTPA